MINEHFTKTKASNQNAHRALYTLLLTAGLLFIGYCVSPLYKGIIGLFCVGAITAAVLIYTKYVGAEYFYDITYDSNNTPIFVVRQMSGKRSTTLCRIDLHSIVKVERLDKAARKEHKQMRDILNTPIYRLSRQALFFCSRSAPREKKPKYSLKQATSLVLFSLRIPTRREKALSKRIIKVKTSILSRKALKLVKKLKEIPPKKEYNVW